MNKELVCIVCPKGCRLTVVGVGEEVPKVSGNSCPKGAVYGIKEVTSPTRVITSTVKIQGAPYNRLPVKTSKDIPKTMIWGCMKAINSICVEAPVAVGTVLLPNVLDTGADIVATRDLEKVE